MFALLKKNGWATSLSAGESGGSLSSRSIFMVHIELTDAGESFPPFLADAAADTDEQYTGKHMHINDNDI